ncbi:MAG: ADP-forming succinate--CoA ligase subunit beta [Dehalococcoidia bacterium]|nr:ADP-forming succinate--CoA ligase subunit beta [Dehalococcoidia bacterium]MDW8008544.1 ADP-forming succinate--CoA ligase subunit beta [Chloroflexota bacterium]
MKVHEFQAKQLLQDYGVPVPRGRVARSPEEAEDIARELGVPVAVKAQIHAGGRGKAGGIKLAATPEEARQAAAQILGRVLVTHQTGPEGRLVRSVLVEEAVRPARELYLAVVIENALGMPVLMASDAGGVDIEEVAATSPERIHRLPVDPAIGFQPFMGRELGMAIGLTGDLLKQGVQAMGGLYRLFMDKDCSLVEVNPLVVTDDGRLLAADAKVNFDDNALFRHPDVQALRDPHEEDPLEVQAQEMGINNYVRLSGNIGCVVNGAGLAMATMDAIKLAGGEPANFLDIGTVNNVERVVNSFRILTSDEQVRAILINIFGGMARVDVIAEGVVRAFREMDVRVPVVVRLAGTNVEAGERILAESGLPVVRARDLGEAAAKAVAAARGEALAT